MEYDKASCGQLALCILFCRSYNTISFFFGHILKWKFMEADGSVNPHRLSHTNTFEKFKRLSRHKAYICAENEQDVSRFFSFQNTQNWVHWVSTTTTTTMTKMVDCEKSSRGPNIPIFISAYLHFFHI